MPGSAERIASIIVRPAIFDDSRSSAISRGLLIIRISSRMSSRFSNFTPGALAEEFGLEPRRATAPIPGVGLARLACELARSGVPIRTVSPRKVVWAVRPPRLSPPCRSRLAAARARCPVSDSAAAPGPSGPSGAHLLVGQVEVERGALRLAVHDQNRPRRLDAGQVIELVALAGTSRRTRFRWLHHDDGVADLLKELRPAFGKLLSAGTPEERRSVGTARGRLRRKRGETPARITSDDSRMDGAS